MINGVRKTLTANWDLIFVFCSAIFVLTSWVGWGKWLALGGDEGFEMVKAIVYSKQPSQFHQLWNDQPNLSTIVFAFILKHVSFSIDIIRYFNILMVASSLVGAIAVIPTRSRLVGWIISIPLFMGYPGLPLLLCSAMLEPLAMSFGVVSSVFYLVAIKKNLISMLIVSAVLLAIGINFKFTSVLYFSLILCFQCAHLAQNGLRELKRATIRIGLFAITTILLASAVYYITDSSFDVNLATHFPQNLIEGNRGKFDPINVLFESPVLIVGIILAALRISESGDVSQVVNAWLFHLAILILVFSIHAVWWNYYRIHFVIAMLPIAIIGYSELFEKIKFFFNKSDRLLRVLIVSVASMITFGVSVILNGSIAEHLKSFRIASEAVPVELINSIREVRGNVKYMYSDRPLLNFYTECLPPPELAVVPAKRFWSGQIDQERIITTLNAYQPEILYFADPTVSEDIKWQDFFKDKYRKIWDGSQGQAWAKYEFNIRSDTNRSDINLLKSMKL